MNESTIGKPVARVDGVAKVTGQARYAAEFNQPRQVYAVVVGATIGLGRVKRIDTGPLQSLPGIVAIISHLNAPRLAYRPHKGAIDPAIGERLHVLQNDQVLFYGQPVAVVIARSPDQAEHAARLLSIDYEARQPAVDLRGAPHTPPQAGLNPGARVPADRARGNADASVGAAPVKIDSTYSIAREHHNPMEPHATVAMWEGDKLTLWSKSQFLVNEAAEIAAVFGLATTNVQVICPFIGGAFGTSLRTWPHVTLAAMAAKHVGLPVKLVLSRRQMFYTTGFRPRTSQRVALGATPDGKLMGIVHEGLGETSRYEQFMEALTSSTTHIYSCPNVRTSYRLAQLDTATPTYMRAPGESSGMFALECAMDELAVALKLDPVELRLRNDARIDEDLGLPFSSRSLRQCFELGAERFGWARRNPRPRSMREGRLLIGWGTAAATYPTLHSPATARMRLLADGMVQVEAAASDMGPGTYTSMTQVAADALGLPVERVRFALGRSDFPPTPSHGGSQTMASVGSAVDAAGRALLQRLIQLAIGDPASPLAGASPSAIEARGGRLQLRGNATRGESFGAVAARAASPVVVEARSQRDPAIAQQYSIHAFGALFVEVAVDPDLGTVKVRRAVGAYGAGRIVNPRLASSQCTGGMVGGIGMALMEQTLLDPRDGRPVNASLADYLVPVNLDIDQLEAHFVDEKDEHVNRLGVKGLGEIALVGVAPAIANAVYHSTGKRVRDLPIRIEHLLGDPLA